jgi:RNA polymerase sigma factor (sigma-70 family)
MTEPLSDQQLLQAYAEEKSEDAFRAIVDRHARWIFAAAFRQLGDRQMAEDTVQIVFVLLARRSHKMPTHQKLSGWLFNTLGYTMKNLRRASRSRQMHEQLAALERSNVTEPSARVNDLGTHLDAAVASLGQADRSAIVLRFYQDRSFGEIAETLGITEIAARKRVSRGTEKLRKRFEKLGARPGPDAAALSVAAVGGLEHAPAALAQSAANVALAAKAGAAIPATILTATKGTAYLMAVAKIKISAAIMLICLLAIPATIVTIRYAPSLLAQSTPPDSPATAAAPASRPADIASYYTLQANQVFKRITNAPPDVRSRFLQKNRIFIKNQLAGARNAQQQGHLIGVSSTDALSANLYSDEAEFPLSQLVNFVCFIRGHADMETEIDSDLASRPLTGDIIFARDASDDELSAAFATFLHDEFAIDAAVAYRDVPRKVIVLHGHWKFKPLPQAPALVDMRQPCIELFGNYALDKQSKSDGSSQTGRPRIARNLGNQLNQQVIIEADGVPDFVSMRSYGEVPGDISNRNLVLQHIQEQTGLTWTEETRTVSRLFIEKPVH